MIIKRDYVINTKTLGHYQEMSLRNFIKERQLEDDSHLHLFICWSDK